MSFAYLEFLKHLFRFKRQVYLDHNATTMISGRVRRAMNRALKHLYGNPSSMYKSGRKSAEYIELARHQVANAIHADRNEIVFTGSATEANNAVLKSLSTYFYPTRKKIISTPIEHPSILQTLTYLATQGITVAYCPVDSQGRVRLSDLEKLVDSDTFLVCCMLANNEIGTLQDIATISGIAHRQGALVLSDCVQALGKFPVDVHAWDIDYASFSAHKLYGPKGVGALYIKHGSPFTPYLHGGHQESGLRAGTESIHNIVGFGTACRDINRLVSHAQRMQKQRQMFLSYLKAITPDCVINSPVESALYNTINVTFPSVHNKELMAVLDYYGVAVSAGSACSSQDEKASSTLKAIGLSDTAAKETIRISMGCKTSVNDIRYTIRVLRNFFEHGSHFVTILKPSHLTYEALNDPNNYILDVRPRALRNNLLGLPNSHEAPIGSIGKYVHLFPRNKHIIVVCQGGGYSYIAAYYLRAKGFEHVSSLITGIAGWKTRQSELYAKYAGQNITVLQQKK